MLDGYAAPSDKVNVSSRRSGRCSRGLLRGGPAGPMDAIARNERLARVATIRNRAGGRAGLWPARVAGNHRRRLPG